MAETETEQGLLRHEPEDSTDTCAEQAVAAINALGTLACALMDDGKELPRVPRTVVGSALMGPPLLSEDGYLVSTAVGSTNNVVTCVDNILSGLTGKHLCFWRVLQVTVTPIPFAPQRTRSQMLLLLVTVVAEQCQRANATPHSGYAYDYGLEAQRADEEQRRRAEPGR